MLAVLSVPLFDPAAVPSPRPCTLASPPRADAVKVGRRANHATMTDFARPHLGRWRARRQACMGRAEDDQTIGHRQVGARSALYAKPTMCARMHRSEFPFRTSLQCGGMGTGTPITCRDCCAIKLREPAYRFFGFGPGCAVASRPAAILAFGQTRL
jgi:hypothetical protein